MSARFIPLLFLLLFSIQAAALSYPLEVFETLPLGETPTARTNVGITHGFPFPEGAVASVNSLRVTGTSTYQFTPLAWHPDGSVKWALVSFMLANLNAGQSDTTTYAIADGGNGSSGGPSICTTSGGTITANTGASGITAVIKQSNYNILDSVTLNSNGTSLVDPGNGGGVFYQDLAGTTFTSATGNTTRFDVVYNGPVYCQVITEGLIENTGMGYRMIYDFYKDSPKINFTFTYKNALFNSNTHKLTNGAWARIGTNMKNVSLAADAAGSDGNPKSFTISPSDAGVVTSYYATSVSAPLGVSALPTNPAGYAVETFASTTFTNPTTTVVNRTAASGVPYYEWLKFSTGNKSLQLTGKYQAFYFPNGYSMDAATGYLDYHFYTPYFPTKPVYVFPWHLYQSREFQINFNASGDGITGTKLYQNKPLFIAVDRTHFGKSEVFFSSPFTSASPGTIQQFMDAPNIPLTNVCSNPTQQGEYMSVERAQTPSATGGGKPNNVYAQVTYSTFTSGARYDYPTKEVWARYMADFEYYLDDKTFTTYPKTTQEVIDFEKNPSNTGQVTQYFPGWQVDIMNEEHNWSYIADLDFYYYTGSEVFKHGMEGVVDRTWLHNFNYYDFVRPMGMEFQALSQALRFLKETQDPRYANHKTFVTTWLSDILNRVSIPKVGTYSNPACDSTPETPALDGVCLIGYMQGSGWIAPPGQKFSSAGLQPEIQAVDFDVYNAYGINSSPGPPSGPDCPDGARYWMMGQRVGLGLLMLYNTYKDLDPANPITETVRLRTLDIARYLSGDAVGDGAYYNDFSNPKNSVGWYQYCLVNKWWSYKGGYSAGDTGNGYLLSYLYTWAAEQATTPAEMAWWQHHAVNEMLAINANAVNGYTFTCDRELDPRAQYSMKSFLDSGLTYTPSNYPAGTPYPDSSATFALASVVPGVANMGVTTLITLNGSLFTSTDKVELGNPTILTLTPTFVASNKLTFNLSSTQAAQLGIGTHAVRVKQGSTYSNSKNLSIQVLTPQLTGISPMAIETTSTGQLFTLTGDNFQSGAQVKVGTLPLLSSTYLNAQGLTFNLSSSSISTLGAGNFDVYVVNPDGGQSGIQTLSILSPGSPVLDSFSPADLEWNTGNTFTLTGSGLQDGAQVVLVSSLNPNIFKAFTSTFVNSGKITFTITAADTQVVGPSIYKVVVKNPDGKLSNNLLNFVVYWPYITGQSFVNFPIDTPVTLTLTGYYFKVGATAHVGTITYTPSVQPPTSLSVSFTPTQLQTLGLGSHDLFVQNPAGGTSNVISFSITEAGTPPSGGPTPPADNGPSTGGSGGGGGGGGSGGGSGSGSGSGNGGSGTGTAGGNTLTCVPAFELCNGIDDDCDNQVDEDCQTSPSTCSNGIQDAGESGVDCGGVCSNFCSLPIPDLSVLLLAALNPLVWLVQAILRLFGL